MVYGNAGTTAMESARLGSANAVQRAEPDESPSQIRDAIGSCEEYLSNMHDLISAVERRLESVLTPASPATASAADKIPTKVSSHVRGRLDILNDGWRNALARLESIRQRVEV